MALASSRQTLAILMMVYDAVKDTGTEATRPALLRIMTPMKAELDELWKKARSDTSLLDELYKALEGTAE